MSGQSPTGENTSFQMDEDQTFVFEEGFFGYSDPENDPFYAVDIVNIAGAGTFFLYGQTFTGGLVYVHELDGDFVFVPTADGSGTGYASFDFFVSNEEDEPDNFANSFAIDVLPVADLPTSADNTITAQEDTAYTFAAADFPFSDVDIGDSLQTLRIVTLPSSGTLLYDGNPVTADFDILVGSIALLTFLPASNANGTGYDSFTFNVSDGTGFSETVQTMTIDVSSVNDAPGGSNNIITFQEDVPYTFVSASVFGFSDVDAGAALYSIRIDSLPVLGSLTLSGQAVSEDDVILVANIGNLVYTPPANSNGDTYASFTFSVNDGTAFDTAPNTITFNINAVNDAPTGTSNGLVTNEDTALVFAAADFGFSDPDQGDDLAFVKINTTPGAGVLALNGVAVVAGQNIAVADLGQLAFTPASNASGAGYASFTFSVGDGEAFAASPSTMTIDVTPANDAPTNIALSATSVAEFRATNTVVGTLNTTDVDAGSSFTYTLLNNAGGRFLIAGNQLRVNNGLLCDFEQDSTHTIQVRVTDNGGATFTRFFNLTLTDVNPEVITGNAAANVLWGGALADTLSGAAGNDELRGNGGNDVLNGGADTDTMLGGDGSDTYFVDAVGDVTTETNATLATGGNDLINSTVSRVLGANIERLTLVGNAAISGTGNALNNTITGNDGSNSLNGMTGNDTLTGGLNSDFFVFNTALNASLNRDTITDFNVAADSVRLDNAIFTKLIQATSATGVTLLPKYFTKNATGAATSLDHRITYETDTGLLRYDADGNKVGGVGSIIFADLAANLLMTNADFLVI